MNLGNLIKHILALILSYIKSVVLAWVVLPTLVPLFFIWTAFSTRLELKWIKYFSFINQDYTTGTFSLDGGDIVKLFGIVSLIFFFIAELLQLLGLKIKISSKMGAVLLSSVFGFAVFLSFYPTSLLNEVTASKSSDFAFLFIVFWIITLTAYGIWYKLNNINQKIYQISRQ